MPILAIISFFAGLNLWKLYEFIIFAKNTETMRRILTIFTFMFCISLVCNGQNAKILKQEKGSIT